MSSFLFHNTIIPIQVTLLGVHHRPHDHDLSQTIIPIQLTLLAVKVLGMLKHTNPLSLNWSWYWDLQKYVNWLCMFLEVNPCFQRAHIFCMDLQPAADPYNVVCNTVQKYANWHVWDSNNSNATIYHEIKVGILDNTCFKENVRTFEILVGWILKLGLNFWVINVALYDLKCDPA